MATFDDLTIRSKDDEARYRRMQDAILGGGFMDDTIPPVLIAALLFMDEDAGVHQEDDRIVMAPGFAMWLPMMVSYTDPVLASLTTIEDRELTDEEAAQVEARLLDWFEIKFECEDAVYPPNVAGKTIWVKIVEDDETICATVRAADGTVVKLPHQVDARRFI